MHVFIRFVCMFLLANSMAAFSFPSADEISEEIDIHAPDPLPGAPMLALPGKKFPLDFMGGEFTIVDHPVFVKEVPNTGLGTGLTIWDGSVVLAKYLEHQLVDLSDATVLELGAGTGVVGVVASVLGARHVYLTDLEYTLKNLRETTVKNRLTLKGKVSIRELDWFKPQSSGIDVSEVSLVLAADVVWIDSLIEPLADTMRWIAQGSKSPAFRMLMAHQTRSRASDTHFFNRIQELGFNVATIPHSEQHPRYQDRDINIFELTWKS